VKTNEIKMREVQESAEITDSAWYGDVYVYVYAYEETTHGWM
jgi:hypothetical protein